MAGVSDMGVSGDGDGDVRDVQQQLLQKVCDVSSAIKDATCVDDVVCALHSLAVLLFPVDSELLSGVVDERHRDQVLDIKLPTDTERVILWFAFYHGVAFPTVAKILIHDVALNWLAFFPLTARTQIYDSFFIRGPSTEVVQALVPSLTRNKLFENIDPDIIYSNVERLLVLCLLDSEGIHIMANEFGEASCREKYADGTTKKDNLSLISRMAQLVVSVPDKSRRESSSVFSSHLFFKKVVLQLLDAGEESAVVLFNRNSVLSDTSECHTFSFIGQMFARVCRRGFADIVMAVTIPRVLNHVRTCILSATNHNIFDIIKSNSKSLFWLNLMGHVKETYAIEKLTGELLCQLATLDINDSEAYWILWTLFHTICRNEKTTRTIFSDKLLLWKVFPICCLRWILQFSVFECPPNSGLKDFHNTQVFLDTIQRLLSVWSKREFVQSTSVEQQAYITAAIGLSLERISKEKLETTRDVLNSILEGVGCRLESPDHLIRQMASCIGLAFSKVVDPKNPLYLDDSCKENETIDWEFGVLPSRKQLTSSYEVKNAPKGKSHGEAFFENYGSCNKVKKLAEKNNLKFSDLKLLDQPSLNGNVENDGDAQSDDSDTSIDSSLLPYNLSDDDTDLNIRFSQIRDVLTALRKTDEPDNVDRALDVAEKLIRASPDELHHSAADLVKTLVQLRCSDIAVEEDEESAEMKRHKSLVAILVTTPFESLDVINKLLFSSNVDASQRFLIIDVMSDAAQELSYSKSTKAKYQNRNMISTISGGQPWFLPCDRGPDGSGSWVDISEKESSLSWSRRYERTIPCKPGKIKAGRSRRWSLGTAKAEDYQKESTINKFPLYAAAFMLPAMQSFDKRKHGVDLLGRDFIVLGKLIHMLGVCMRCMAMHPEASALAPALLDMLSSRDVAHHVEAYVRRSVLYAASCTLGALHPSFVASALIEGDKSISSGLEWIRTWAFHISETDPDTECTSMAVRCLQLHAEMALQTSRTLESADCFRAKTGFMSSKKTDIILPTSGTLQVHL